MKISEVFATNYAANFAADEDGKSHAGHMRHEFGGQHTELKLQVVGKYLKQFATALKPHFPKLWYIDAFAGTGSRTVRHEARVGDLLDAAVPERIEQRRGSARIAIDVTPQFDTLVFMESKPLHYTALQRVGPTAP
jgi:three-Cys-motif partner protein